jgi:HEPN domain-containing protein
MLQNGRYDWLLFHGLQADIDKALTSLEEGVYPQA